MNGYPNYSYSYCLRFEAVEMKREIIPSLRPPTYPMTRQAPESTLPQRQEYGGPNEQDPCRPTHPEKIRNTFLFLLYRCVNESV